MISDKELLEYADRAWAVMDDIEVCHNFFDKRMTAIQPFIKGLSLKDSEQFIKSLNATLATYDLRNKVLDNVHKVRVWGRDEKTLVRHKNQITNSVKKLREITSNNPNSHSIEEKLIELEKEIEVGLEIMGTEKQTIQRITMKDIRYNIDIYIEHFNIKVNEAQINKLLLTIPKHY